MNNLLIINIKALVGVTEKPIEKRSGKAMMDLPMLENAFLYCENGKIKDFGSMSQLPENYRSASKIEDAQDRFVLPTFADPHTHIVFAKSREEEFIYKIKGLSYAEIAAKGGGILNSAAKLRQTSEDELYESAMQRLDRMILSGIGAVEIKSGYGLSVADEIKMLRVVKRIKETAPLTVKATFLGAHAFPKEYSRSEYINLIINEMIPQIAKEGLADYCDVFCDQGFFTPEETAAILQKGNQFGLTPKIHANELAFSGGVQTGVAHNALSVDHLECVGDEEIEVLLHSRTMPTLLPSTAFFLGIEFPPARKMIDAGLPIALATDFNPGSSPSGNMLFILSLACIKLKMLPEEALNAATVNAAYAMGLNGSHGVISKNIDANFFITKKIPSLAYIPYSFGENTVEKVFLKGKMYK